MKSVSNDIYIFQHAAGIKRIPFIDKSSSVGVYLPKITRCVLKCSISVSSFLQDGAELKPLPNAMEVVRAMHESKGTHVKDDERMDEGEIMED